MTYKPGVAYHGVRKFNAFTVLISDIIDRCPHTHRSHAKENS